MEALVTGANGFIGAALVRALLQAGHRVRGLVRPAGDRRALEGLPAEIVHGDVTDRGSILAAVKGCGWVFHVAALYQFWARDRRAFYTTNVEGTRNVLEAAGEAGAQRVVYTSTVGVFPPSANGRPATEEAEGTVDQVCGDYKRSKFLAEAEARGLARRGLPVVIVNPSAPVGPGDWKPTPTGQMIVDFLNGKMWAYMDTGLNIIGVEDVAAGHILAAERGRPGQRYILGDQNLALQQIFAVLAEVSGIPAPRVKVPRAVVLPLGYVSQWVAEHVTGRPPQIPLDAARMAQHFMFFDPRKAREELGLCPGPAEDALRRAARWFAAQGYVRAAAAARILRAA
jgi:dihydroflavonol-4-reductase